MNAMRKQFVLEYLIDLDATNAAKRAGYSEKTAYSQGGRLLKNVEVKAAIDKAMDKRAMRTQVTADRVLQELARVAFVDPRKIMSWGPDGVTFTDSSTLTEDEAAVVSEASQTISENGGSIRIKLADKLQALNMLGKHLGMFKDELFVKGELEVQVTEEVIDNEPATTEENNP